MKTLSSVVPHLGVVLGTLCAIAGFAFQGVEGAVLGCLVGYFLGKTVQSTIWAFTGGPAT